MLSDQELNSITLNAELLHSQIALPRPLDAINRLGAKNFFVRYRTSKSSTGAGGAAADGSRHRWSRILKVWNISEWNGPGVTVGGVRRDSVLWNGKVFTIGIEVAGEPRLVMLPSISNHPPTTEEVKAYCAREANHRSDEGGDEGNTGLTPSHFLPSSMEVKLLNSLRATIFDSQRATEGDPRGGASQLTRRKAAPQIGLSASQGTLQLPAQQQQQQHLFSQVQSSQPPSQSSQQQQQLFAAPPDGEDEYELTPALSQATDLWMPSQRSMDESQPLQILIPPPLSATAASMCEPSGLNSPTSPFVPRKRLRTASVVAAGHPDGLFAFASPRGGSSSQTGEGFSSPRQSSRAGSTAFSPTLHVGSPQGPRRPTSLLDDSGMVVRAEMVQLSGGDGSGSPTSSQLSHLTDDQRAYVDEVTSRVNRFSAYVNDEQRVSFSRQVSSISQRNAAVNQRNRRVGLENEKRLKRVGNLTESKGGLWVTDDAERSLKARSYSQRDEADGAKAAPTAAETSATSGRPSGGDGSDEAEEQRLQRPLPQPSLASVSMDLLDVLAAVPPQSPISTPSSSPVRMGHETSMMLITKEGAGGAGNSSSASLPPEVVTAQLIHRSAVIHAGLTQ